MTLLRIGPDGLRLACLCALGWFVSAPVSAYSVKVTSQGASVRWASSVDSVELALGPDLEGMLEPGLTYAAVAIATEAWRGYDRVPELKISDRSAPPYDPERRQNGIYLLNPWPFEAERVAVTVTSYQSTGQLLGVDVLINGEIDYGVLPEGVVPVSMMRRHDLAAVLTHELGHVLGLDESMDDPAATMWPYVGPGETHQRTLGEDDEAAISELYATELREQVVGCGQSSIMGQGARDTPLAALACVALLLVRRRRSHG